MINKIKSLYKRMFWSAERYARHLGVKVGQDCSIGIRYFGSEPYLVTIGNHVQITNNVRLFTHGGGWIYRQKNPDFDAFGKIVIMDNVYIGNNALILPGVTIGNNVIVAAGAVVTKSIKNDKIVAGNPAKIIGEVKDLENRLKPFNVKSKGMDSLTKKEYLLTLSDSKFIKK
jgi:acetyltransferase-like isoleucine patch superfamily enzyme